MTALDGLTPERAREIVERAKATRPEDVGFDEHIAALRERLAVAEKERDEARGKLEAMGAIWVGEAYLAEKKMRESAEARLAEVTAQRDSILLQARSWAMEAKAQRHTVNEVGSVLGGMADWQGIASAVSARLASLAGEVERLREALRSVDDWWGENWDCSASPGHDGYPYEAVRAALASGETTEVPISRPDEAVDASPTLSPAPSRETPDAERDAVEAFVKRVNARAEADMLAGNPVTGAHHRAIETELAALRAARNEGGANG